MQSLYFPHCCALLLSVYLKKMGSGMGMYTALVCARHSAQHKSAHETLSGLEQRAACIHPNLRVVLHGSLALLAPNARLLVAAKGDASVELVPCRQENNLAEGTAPFSLYL